MYAERILAAAIVAALAACRPSPVVKIDEPRAEVVGNTVTFRWHLEPADSPVEYQYEILLDKGEDPCDGHIEESFPAGSMTCRTVSLDRNRFHPGAKAQWAIRASAHSGQQCVYGGNITIDQDAPPAPCGGG